MNETKKTYERPLIEPFNTYMPGKGAGIQPFRTLRDIEGHDVEQLVLQFGSPLFVISEKKIEENIQAEKNAFGVRYPKTELAWSYKTNYLDAVCQVMHRNGSLAEVVSEFEYDKAIANGVDGQKIIINGPNKTDSLIEKAIANKSLLHVDNFDEIYEVEKKCEAMGQKARCGIRINPQKEGANDWNKFGFATENGQAWEGIKRIAESQWMELEGLHCHIGTFVTNAKSYGNAAKKLVEIAKETHNKLHIKIKYIDLGGGFASRNKLKQYYATDTDATASMNEYANEIAQALEKMGTNEQEMPTLVLETGRALVDDTAILLTTILANKRSPNGKRSTIIDAGVNILFTAFWYDHNILPTKTYGRHAEACTIYGPLCMNIDIVRENALLPLVKKGDRLAIENVGAYNMTQSMSFINLRPAVVMIGKDGAIRQIRRKETLDDIERMERQ